MCGLWKVSQRPSLCTHERTHLGKRLYLCVKCEKSFQNSSNLKSHRRAHSKVKSCRCSECGKSFLGSLDLSRHQRFHTGESSRAAQLFGKLILNKQWFCTVLALFTVGC
ncbi:---NA--- [Podarcis lilfordi]|uniref:---NA n=1 Tax=Podarcis lilfordi TaxID=74358 RepID=A0AA35P121_9SAUR|nr:---NA--- [Podarcis lilfordi]